MADYGTIKIPSEDYERHNERRQDLGLTWAEYIDGEAPEFAKPDAEDIAEEIKRDLASVTGPSEIAYDEISRRVVEDLTAQLPPRIAEELA